MKSNGPGEFQVVTRVPFALVLLGGATPKINNNKKERNS